MGKQAEIRVAVAMLLTIVIAGLVQADSAVDQSQSPTSTPIIIQLASPTPLPTLGSAPTNALPTFTEAADAPVQLQALETAGAVNVRAQADPNADRLGTIRYGEYYTVTGRYFRWLQIRFDSSPNGRGWVFEELIEIIGDPARIPDLSENAPPTVDPAIIGATQTWEAIGRFPGGFLTVTANARVIAAPPSGISNSSIAPESTGEVLGSSGAVLPTYTYPPNIVALVPTEASGSQTSATPEPGTPSTSASDGVAPIVPIIVLTGLGLIGLAISTLRR